MILLDVEMPGITDSPVALCSRSGDEAVPIVVVSEHETRSARSRPSRRARTFRVGSPRRARDAV